jgi:nitrogen fixation/metabolism regulation signal transduction histidine kinase
MAQERGGMSLIGTVRRDFVALIVILGLLIAGIVYHFLGSILRERFDQQTSFIATNLADSAAGYVASRDVLQLHTLVAKYGRLEGVAYAFIQDREGNVLANSLGTTPSELQENFAYGQRQVGKRVLTLQGKPVYESRGSILEGQLGTARLGIWGDAIDKEIYQGFLRLLGPIVSVLIAAVGVALLLAGRLTRPLRRLMEIAGRMSTGDLDTPVRAESQDEFGELTHSLERMRASLKAAMMRLDQN